jgi:hypothetical protein
MGRGGACLQGRQWIRQLPTRVNLAAPRGYRPDLSAVVQDDEGGRGKRTQPGVSTLQCRSAQTEGSRIPLSQHPSCDGTSALNTKRFSIRGSQKMWHHPGYFPIQRFGTSWGSRGVASIRACPRCEYFCRGCAVEVGGEMRPSEQRRKRLPKTRCIVARSLRLLTAIRN